MALRDRLTLSGCPARQATLCVPLNSLFVLQGPVTEPVLGGGRAERFLCLLPALQFISEAKRRLGHFAPVALGKGPSHSLLQRERQRVHQASVPLTSFVLEFGSWGSLFRLHYEYISPRNFPKTEARRYLAPSDRAVTKRPPRVSQENEGQSQNPAVSGFEGVIKAQKPFIPRLPPVLVGMGLSLLREEGEAPASR